MQGTRPSGLRPDRRARTGRRATVAAALLSLSFVAGLLLRGPGPASWQGFQEHLGATPPVTSAAGGSAAPGGGSTPGSTSAPGQPLTDPPSTPPADRPTPSGSTARLHPAPVTPVGGGSHTYVAVQSNGVSPVAYDPCRPVHYVLRPDLAPAGGEDMVHAAAARLSEATGLEFVFDGYSDEPLRADREPYQPARYGDRWAPVLVGWQTATENPALAGDVVGQGGSLAVSLGDGPRVYVTGTVALDADQFPEILGRPDGPAVAGAIVLHEFAHLVGLGHVDDTSQLMNPETVRGVTDFGTGDLAGLARLGRGACAPDL